MDNSFSIITVVRNDEKNLKTTLQSIASQNYTHIQSIVIDGKSTDNTYNIARESSSVDIVISEPDSGIYDAMNKGIHYAENEWCIFLNAGDMFYHNEVLSELHAYINTYTTPYPIQIIFGATQEILHNQAIIRSPVPTTNMPISLPACHQSILIRSSLLKEYLFNEQFKICGDLDQIARILKSISADNIAYYPHIISSVHAEGSSTRYWKTAIKERSVVQKKYYNTRTHRNALFLYHVRFIIKKIY